MKARRIQPHEVSGAVMECLMKTETYLKGCSIDHKLLELIKYRASQINGCVNCLDMHHKEAIRLGETEKRLHTVAAWKESPFFTEKERAALAYTDALTLVSKSEIDDELFGELTRYFSKQEIADLTLAITQINTWNRINKAFKVVPVADQQAESKVEMSAN
ncbi:MAG: carboxymuconolactone decarboxylase family protein [Chitinophagaceae bacterium]|nr:carboxymuconolactone decarboxylase family protein [Chitinophagaceae bacterium]